MLLTQKHCQESGTSSHAFLLLLYPPRSRRVANSGTTLMDWGREADVGSKEETLERRASVTIAGRILLPSLPLVGPARLA